MISGSCVQPSCQYGYKICTTTCTCTKQSDSKCTCIKCQTVTKCQPCVPANALICQPINKYQPCTTTTQVVCQQKYQPCTTVCTPVCPPSPPSCAPTCPTPCIPTCSTFNFPFIKVFSNTGTLTINTDWSTGAPANGFAYQSSTNATGACYFTANVFNGSITIIPSVNNGCVGRVLVTVRFTYPADSEADEVGARLIETTGTNTFNVLTAHIQTLQTPTALGSSNAMILELTNLLELTPGKTYSIEYISTTAATALSTFTYSANGNTYNFPFITSFEMMWLDPLTEVRRT